MSQQAQNELRATLRTIDYSRPVDEWRDTVIGIVDACCSGASQVSAMESAIFYDGLRQRVVGKTMGTQAHDGRSSMGTEKAVKAFIGKLLEGDYDAFENLCCERLDYEINASSGRCMAHNAGHDPDAPRFARVPQGERTCDFCIMLASRGPVYHTAESAGALTKFHTHCDCKIMPFWNTYAVKTENGGIVRRSGRTAYEGYDPDAYFEQYLSLATEKFKNRMAAAADKAHAEHGGSWSAGLSRKDMNILHGHIGAATSYEDLVKRVDFVDSGPYYLTNKQWNELLDHARQKRRELLGDDK